MNIQRTPEFSPLWEEQYKQHPLLREAVDFVQNLENLTELEAERKVLDILIRATFIESCLQHHGKLKADELLENLQKIAQEHEKQCPFETIESLEEFLGTMDVLFIKDRHKKYQNSGAGYRKFVQFLYNRLQVGDPVNLENLNEVTEEFHRTFEDDWKPEDDREVIWSAPRKQNRLRENFENRKIRMAKDDDEARKNRLLFRRNEFQLEFSSLKLLAREVIGFSYDNATESISLTSSASSRLALRLPILVSLVTTGGLDISRTTSGYMRPTTSMCKVLSGVMVSGPIAMARANLRLPIFKQDVGILERIWVQGAIQPNNDRGQVEVFSCIPYAHNASDGFWAPRTSRSAEKLFSGRPDFPSKQEEFQKLMEMAAEVDPTDLFLDPKTFS